MVNSLLDASSSICYIEEALARDNYKITPHFALRIGFQCGYLEARIQNFFLS